jgi:predicted alpha/beta superfamily hydrolase
VAAGLTRPLRTWVWLAAVGLAGAAAAAEVQVDFEADLSTEMAQGRFDPARDTVGLRGACPPLSWQRSLPLVAATPGRYSVRVAMDTQACGGQPLQHKFHIHRPGQGPDQGWEPGRNHAALLDVAGPATGVRVARVFGAPAVPPPSRVTGTVLTLPAVATAHVLPRPVWVWLPPGYEEDTQRRYPVLYLHDGQNMFDARDSGAEWQVDETAHRLVQAAAVLPFIVVAVPSGLDRMHELTPNASLLRPQRSGQAQAARVGGGLAAYASYLVQDLKPAVDARWRTLPGPQATAVGGSSLGGLASLWLALHRPGTFGAALVVSPSLWWDEHFALRDLQALPLAVGQALPRLWLDMGGQEGEGALAAARQLRDALLQRGWALHGAAPTLAYTEAPDGRHDEASWALRVEGMLRFLYGAAPPLPMPLGASGTPRQQHKMQLPAAGSNQGMTWPR